MRIIIPLLAVILGVLAVLGMLSRTEENEARNPARQTTVQTQPADLAEAPAALTQANEGQDNLSGIAVETDPSAAPIADAPVSAAPTPSVPAATFAEAPVILPAEQTSAITIGSTDPESGFKFEIQLSPWGAAVSQVALTDYLNNLEDRQPYIVHGVLKAPIPGTVDGEYLMRPFSAVALTIAGHTVDLMKVERWTLIPTDHSGIRDHATYRTIIATGDDANTPLVEVTRTYRVVPGSYQIAIDQKVRNLTSLPLNIVWSQFLQGDLPRDGAAYLGDRRYYVPGYFNLEYDARKFSIYTDDAFLSRVEALRNPALWPTPDVTANSELAWIAGENRYFAVITHLPVPANTTRSADIKPLETLFPRLNLYALPQQPVADDARLSLVTASTPTLRLEPDAEHDLSITVFAGPRKNELFEEAPYSILHFDKTIRYSLGGLIDLCTFQWLAHALLGFLGFFHWLLADWGVAIIVLVVTVRLILHPIMKKSQLSMMRMGKIMQKLQPEIEKLKKKHKDDPAALQQEQLKLMRDAGASPFGMLGCLPLFLQMPIWTALYAMLYYAIELRQEPAFWGVFQWVSGGNWTFLADLAAPDHFIVFAGDGITIPLYFIEPTFNGINILPLLMAVVFFINNKLMSPPPANEQQAQMQRTMRIMFLIFPFFLYSAPAGLTLYMTASTGAGILDSWIVRRHLQKEEESGKLFEKKQPKPGGLMDRFSKAMEQARAQYETQQNAKAGGKTGRKHVNNEAGQPGGRATARKMKRK
ncbi:MAG: YidC/Oxa1 family insertase periplasmic-domain containing protein [Phycisphaeraceae bacterium]